MNQKSWIYAHGHTLLAKPSYKDLKYSFYKRKTAFGNQLVLRNHATRCVMILIDFFDGFKGKFEQKNFSFYF